MKWALNEPRPGDMIRVKTGSIYHYGIYDSDDRIIQFGLNPALRPGLSDSQVEVCCSDMEQFLCGGFLEVAVPEGRERKKLRTPEQTVALARQRLGERGYNLLHNNCEHFAYECATGERISSQADQVRAMFQSLSTTNVYVAQIPKGRIGKVVPALRQEYIRSTENEALRRQRYYVWKLLEYALRHSYGLNMKDLTFTRDASGRWSCPDCCFSLSHCRTAVAVAVSKKPVGVDIEELDSANHPLWEKLSGKILTEEEQAAYDQTPEAERPLFLTKKWCAKESLFKAGTEAVFRPEQLNTASGVTTGITKTAAGSYCYAAASQDILRMKLYENIKL